MATLIRHTLKPPKLKRTYLGVDIGCGIRPCRWNFDRMIYVEPYSRYVDVLRSEGLDVFEKTAIEFLREKPVFVPSSTILMLDVIEHMPKEEGEEVIALAQDISNQVVIYTPKTFVKQTHDAWNLGGDEWQTHRSAWAPSDFDGWNIEMRGKGFFATWAG